jgi:hypothetical protein
MKGYNEIIKFWNKNGLIIGGNDHVEEIFRKEYGKKSVNFMTPHIIGYGVISVKGIVYELSQGEGFDYEDVYGISVCDTEKRYLDDSKCFFSLEDALDHVLNLIKKYE